MLTETPRANTKKTKSVLNRARDNTKIIAYLLASVLLIVVSYIVYSSGAHEQACTPVGENCYHLEVASSSGDRAKGLSGRESLRNDRGMLFVFDRTAEHCMWMKGMNFALDMIWIDEQGNVIEMKRDISPESYPASICPAKSAKYVIELNAGQIVESELKVGDQIMIN